MTVKYSIADSNWKDDTAWSLSNGGPNDTTHPVSGDAAIITGGNHITTDADGVACQSCNVNAGHLTLGGDMVLNDSVWAKIQISGTAGTAVDCDAWGHTIRSASAAPTYPFPVIIAGMSPDGRAVTLDGLNLVGNAPCLALSATEYYLFNANPAMVGATGLILTQFGIKATTPHIISHAIPSRVGDRIHWNGTSAPVMKLAGYCLNNAQNLALLEYFTSQSAPWGYAGRTSHMRRCLVADVSLPERAGNSFVYFTITLEEDR